MPEEQRAMKSEDRDVAGFEDRQPQSQRQEDLHHEGQRPRGKRSRGKRPQGERRQGKRPRDQRPYIRDAGRRPQGAVEVATVTVGMVLLALAFGFVIGFLVFLVMNASTWLTALIWTGYLGNSSDLPLFPLLVCGVGGLVVGLWTRFSGSSIDPLEVVMKEFRETGNYDLGGTGKATVSFLLPLVFGGSVGFEAGLTGIITAACCWIRDKLKMAGLREAAVTDVTIAASLSAIFGAPFAGIVAGAESSPRDGEEVFVEPDVNDYNMRKSTKLVLYTAAAFGAFAGIHAFSSLFGVTAGFPRFDSIGAEGAGYLWGLIALMAGYALVLVYFASQFLFSKVSSMLEPFPVGTVVKPLIAGIVLGLLAMVFPYVLFPGETQCHELMQTWGTWGSLALVGTGVLKAFATPMCIKMGWVGGNFCPCIFAGAACGYGLAQLTQADPVLMVTIVVAVFLAGVLRKPVLAIALLLLFFPLNGIVWMGIAAVVGSLLPVPAFLLSEE